MRVSDGQPQPGQSRRAANYRPGSGKRGRLPTHVLSSAPFAEGKQLARPRHDAVKLHRRGLSITRGESRHRSSCADTLLHRRDQVTDVRVEHRTRQARIALRAKMAVITRLTASGSAMPSWPNRSGAQGPERNHALACIERTLVRLYPPIAAGTVQRPRIARQEDAAKAGKTRRIGPCYAERIADARSLRPEHSCANTGLRDGSRCQCSRAVSSDCSGNARTWPPDRTSGAQRFEALFSAVNLEPTGPYADICVAPASASSVSCSATARENSGRIS